MVYPRVCGGTRRLVLTCRIVAGLSPRVRGNLVRPLLHELLIGSIPACAGEPHPYCVAMRHETVYPRVCGGTQQPGQRPLIVKGLSPRVRGNLANSSIQIHTGRSIPACAGEPAGSPCKPGRAEVYPRVCGGTPGKPKTTQQWRGLSPRVRGNLKNHRTERMTARSIPACAGEPVDSDGTIYKQAVYPRVCGGTQNLIICSD